MQIINAHAHVYPQKIAQKATETIGEFYHISMTMPVGTPERLLQDGKEVGISRHVIHSVATTPHQVRSINEFIKNETDKHPEFIGFIALHQDLTIEEINSEVDFAIANGFKGIKLHPDFQKFNIDDENAQKLFKTVGDRLPFLIHMGDDRYDYSKPYRLINMAKKYPNVRFISAHFGGYQCWNEVSEYKGLNNVYYDTSSSLPFISESRAKEIIDMLGVDKFFFGTDFPMWDAKSELERFNKIPLSDTERKMILSENIKKFLNI